VQTLGSSGRGQVRCPVRNHEDNPKYAGAHGAFDVNVLVIGSLFDMNKPWIHINAVFGSCPSGPLWPLTRSEFLAEQVDAFLTWFN
jgi:hypothetical protein